MAMHWDRSCTITCRPHALLMKEVWKNFSVYLMELVQVSKLTFISSLGLGRDEAGSEHRRKKSWKAGEYSSGWRNGGQRSAYCCVSEKGGSVSAISHTVAPNDHTSVLRALYGGLFKGQNCMEHMNIFLTCAFLEPIIKKTLKTAWSTISAYYIPAKRWLLQGQSAWEIQQVEQHLKSQLRRHIHQVSLVAVDERKGRTEF